MSADIDRHQLVGSSENLPAPTIQDYLTGGRRVSDLHSKVWSDVHMLKGIGQTFVPEQDNTLYHYDAHPLFRVLSRGGRLIVGVSKVLLPMTSTRQGILRRRFLQVDRESEPGLANHLDRLLTLTDPRYLPQVSREFITGEFRLFMLDLRTPFVYIGEADGTPLVVPLELIQRLSELGIRPRCGITYSGQLLLYAHSEDHTVRVIYSTHLMDKTLFRPRWM